MLCSFLKAEDWFGHYFCIYYFLSPVEKNCLCWLYGDENMLKFSDIDNGHQSSHLSVSLH